MFVTSLPRGMRCVFFRCRRKHVAASRVGSNDPSPPPPHTHTYTLARPSSPLEITTQRTVPLTRPFHASNERTGQKKITTVSGTQGWPGAGYPPDRRREALQLRPVREGRPHLGLCQGRVGAAAAGGGAARGDRCLPGPCRPGGIGPGHQQRIGFSSSGGVFGSGRRE